jgi:hypothetical protein
VTRKKEARVPRKPKETTELDPVQKGLLKIIRERALYGAHNKLTSFMVLPPPQTMRLLGVSKTEAERRITILIDGDIQAAVRGTAEVMIDRYLRNRKFDYLVDEPFEAELGSNEKERKRNFNVRSKSVGIMGDLAVLSVLNERDLDDVSYRFDHHLLYMPQHKLGPDFVLYPSRIKLEVKTADMNPRYKNLVITKKLWDAQIAAGLVPDVVLALKQVEMSSISKDTIKSLDVKGLELTDYQLNTFEVMGWAKGEAVKREFDEDDDYICPDAPCYKIRFEKLNKIRDFKSFIRQLARDGHRLLQ